MLICFTPFGRHCNSSFSFSFDIIIIITTHQHHLKPLQSSMLQQALRAQHWDVKSLNNSDILPADVPKPYYSQVNKRDGMFTYLPIWCTTIHVRNIPSDSYSLSTDVTLHVGYVCILEIVAGRK